MAKNLIVCCDGTWNRREQTHPTNVSRIFDLVAESSTQRRYYHRGVGTAKSDRLLGGAFGVGLSQSVRESYRWIAEQYEPGDRLYLFGFSRGAYTARSVAGLIRNAGVLTRANLDQVAAAYALYRSKSGPDAEDAVRFRDDYAHPGAVPIEFIGVWDTVGSLGVPAIQFLRFGWLNRRWAFHDVQLSSRVRHAFHGLSLDEKRGPFVPTLWQPQPAARDQEVEQVWFSGVHVDVGGGYPEHGLADITLAWMVDRARRCGLDVMGAPEPAPSAALDVVHDSMTTFYRLLGPRVRDVGRVDPQHESLSSTAARRMADAQYGTPPARAWLLGGAPQMQV